LINKIINPRDKRTKSTHLVARSRASADQWAVYLDPSAPPVVASWAAFQRELFGMRGHCVLAPVQVRSLWQRMVAESNWASRLLDSRSVAAWAASAWSLCKQYEIDLGTYAAPTREVRVLVEWGATYDDTLQRKGWIDPANISAAGEDTAELGDPQILRLLDFAERTPAETRWLDRLGAAGWEIESSELPEREARTFGHSAPNAEAELEAALDWAHARVSANPTSRIAIVVPPAYATGSTLIREFGDIAVSVGFARDPSPMLLPPVAAALNALELFTPRGNLRTFSAWLRSPFFHGHSIGGASAAARIEAELRGSLFVQLDFLTAFRSAGLHEFIRRHDPTLADRLSRASNSFGDTLERKSPTRWTELWQSNLRMLGWMSALVAGRDSSMRVLDAVFSDVSRLTPIVGPVSQRRAFDEVLTIAMESASVSRMPVSGIHVLEHVDDVGPGFDAVWAIGISDGAWPQRHSPNPLLPRSLQMDFDLPYARPGDAVQRAKRSLARLQRAAPEVVVSWPQRDEDAPRTVTPLIGHWQLDVFENPVAARARPACQPAAIESRLDAPPPLTPPRIRGGASMLNAQAACPLRAFLDFRLDAQPLERWGRGVTPRLRGIMLHRAADRLLPAGMTAVQLAAADPAEFSNRIAEVAERTLRQYFGAAAAPLLHLFMLERRRFIRVLERLTEAECRRADFTIVAVEQAATIHIDDWVLQARLDRLDRLAGGELAIIDYKTGRQHQAPRWFGASLGDLQLPLYTLAVPTPVTAAVLCHLGPEEVRYRGYWEPKDAFPERPERLNEGRTWPQQLASWEVLIRILVTEFAAGDVRIKIAASDMLEGLYAPVSRIYEQLALHRANSV
jgi:probable DNA repair protein